MRIIQCQTHVYESKERNLLEIGRYVAEASSAHPDIITFGEMCTCPYDTRRFAFYAEEDGGPSFQFFSDMAKRYGIWISAGTLPEKDAEGHIYNTAYVFDRSGKCVAKHRKSHLFDIDIKASEDHPGQSFHESESLTAGDEVTVFDTEFGKAGLAVCFDVRFPEDFVKMAEQGVKFILIPAAFNTTTGPLHWELLLRARAVDTQCFVIATSPARDPDFSYQAWGHSLVVDPTGKVLIQTDEAPGLSGTDADLALCGKVREEIPLHRGV
ncbi:MAG: carbon-nitrogen hydrolase family protein [Eubacteriales bacterium]|jgi:predicted amidohydrolase